MSRRASILLVGLLASPPTWAIAEDRPTPESIRRAIDLHWQSIDRFLVECDEFAPDQDGERKPGTVLTHYEFVSGKGGQKRMRVTHAKPDGTEQLVEDVREDGRNRYRSYLARDQTYRIATLPQQSKGHDWNGTLCAPLWIMLPAGMTLAQHLDAGAKLEVMPDGETAKITFKHNGTAGVCELSGRHGWMARSLTLDGGLIRFVADGFGRADGRWYPSSGHFEFGGPNGLRTSYRFDVTKFRYKARPDPHLFDFRDEARPKVE